MVENQEFNQNQEDHGEVLHQWSFREFDDHSRPRSWYVVVGIVAVVGALYSIYNANYLFALIILMAVAIMVSFHRSNNQIQFSITEDGILVNRTFIGYDDLDHFFIIYEPGKVKRLYIEPKAFSNPRIPISLEDQNPIEIRETLLRYIEENLDRKDEPITDQIGRFLKL